MYPLSIPGFRTFIVNGNIWPLFVRFFYSIYRDNALVFYIWQNWRIPNTHTLSLFKPIKSLLLVFAPFLFRCVWRPGGPSSHLRKNFSKNLPMICSFSYFSIYPGFFISQDLWASFDRFCSRSLTLVVFRDLTINIQCILLKWRILLRGPGSQPACLPAYLTKCFTSIVPQNQLLDEFYAVQKRGSTDFEVLHVWIIMSGSCLLLHFQEPSWWWI